MEHLPSIPEIEIICVQLIALILLVIAGVQLILDAGEPLARRVRGRRQDRARPRMEVPPHKSWTIVPIWKYTILRQRISIGIYLHPRFYPTVRRGQPLHVPPRVRGKS